MSLLHRTALCVRWLLPKEALTDSAHTLLDNGNSPSGRGPQGFQPLPRVGLLSAPLPLTRVRAGQGRAGWDPSGQHRARLLGCPCRRLLQGQVRCQRGPLHPTVPLRCRVPAGRSPPAWGGLRCPPQGRSGCATSSVACSHAVYRAIALPLRQRLATAHLAPAPGTASVEVLPVLSQNWEKYHQSARTNESPGEAIVLPMLQADAGLLLVAQLSFLLCTTYTRQFFQPTP